MKPEHLKIAKYLALCLGVLTVVATPAVRAADDTASATQKLQDENAQLKQQVADLEARLNSAPAATTTTTTTTSTNGTAATAATGSGVTVLSPFEVAASPVGSYIVTNANTGTRINQPIQEIPMYLQVLSSDFIKDTNMQNLTDILKYTAAATGDAGFASDRPTNSSTPVGNFTIRGFTVNNIERDGTFTYQDFNLDNVDHVEVVEGPAAIFYGAGYPGGVINLVTKQPQFGRIPTTMYFQFGQNNSRKGVFDENQAYGDKAAMRVVGGWQNGADPGQRDFELFKNIDFSPSVSIMPFKSGRLKITFEEQYLKYLENYNNNGWFYPTGWFLAYGNPSTALMAAAGITSTNSAGLTPTQQYQARIFPAAAGYGTWGTDYQNLNHDPSLPVYTSLSPYGYYNDLSGNRIQDTHFNFHNRGSQYDNDDNTVTGVVAASPTDWLDLHYTYTRSTNCFNDLESNNYPNADGTTWQADQGGTTAGYHNNVMQQAGDAVIKFDKWGIHNKLFGGFLYQKELLQYYAGAGTAATTVNGVAVPGAWYGSTPGANNSIANPGFTFVPQNFLNSENFVPTSQVLYSRTGQILNVQQVYTMWDPAVNIQPDSASLFPTRTQNQIDGYPMQQNDWYWADQINALHDKLHFLYGYRSTEVRNSGQALTNNFPYYSPPVYGFYSQNQFPSNFFNYSPSYQLTNFEKTKGSAFQWGVSYDLTKEVTAYVTYSTTFLLNATNAGGFALNDIGNIVGTALAYGGGSYVYKGTTITSATQGESIILASGAANQVGNQTGKNWEGGFKTSLWDGKINATLSLFRGTRNNLLLDNSAAQANASEPYNYSTTLFPSTSIYYNSRIFRWRTTGQLALIDGAEATASMTPIRNLQSIVNWGYMPTARNVSQPTYTPAYAALSTTNAVNYNIFYDSRIAAVPTMTFSTFNKYTFTDGPLAGLAIGGGANYVSERVYSQSATFNPLNGGLMLPAYWDFDGTVAYSYDILGYKLSTQLGLYNISNSTQFPGDSPIPNARFNWVVTESLQF
jgi:outer membrane receptor protein involved in Fe transport